MTQAAPIATELPLVFDQLPLEWPQEHVQHKAMEASETMLVLGKVAMDFARVYRVPRYDETSRESDAEHSFMVALIAPEIAVRYFPDLDPGLVSQFGIVHDLIELETGDVATFTLDEAGLAAKDAAEHAALGRLTKRLPAYTAELMLRYEAQDEPEAIFVKLLEKKLPVIVDIFGPGKKVMAEDYNIHSLEQLNAAEAHMSTRLRRKFCEPEHQFLHAVRDLLALEFQREYLRY